MDQGIHPVRSSTRQVLHLSGPPSVRSSTRQVLHLSGPPPVRSSTRQVLHLSGTSLDGYSTHRVLHLDRFFLSLLDFSFLMKISHAFSCHLILSFIFYSPAAIAQNFFARTYGTDSNAEVSYCGQQTSEGGFILAGSSSGASYSIVKTDAGGDTLWTKSLQSITIYGVTEIPGGYIFTGGPHITLLKTDFLGNTVWSKTFSSNINPDADYGYGVQRTTDNSYIITGQKNYNPQNFIGDICLIKTDSSGNLKWQRLLTSGLTDCNGRSVQQTSDGGFIVAGNTNNGLGNFSGYDWCLIKTDSAGIIQWQKYFGSDPVLGLVDRAYCVRQTTDGGYIVSGTYSESLSESAYVVKTDANGDTLWTRNYGQPSQGFEFRSIWQTNDGGYVSTGPASSDLVLVKMNSAGDTMWTKIVDGSDATMSFYVQQTTDGGYVMMGSTAAPEFSNNMPNGYDHLIIRTDSLGNFPDPTATSVTVTDLAETISVYPVPASEVHIRVGNPENKSCALHLFDAHGLEAGKIDFSGSDIVLHKNNFSQRFYFFFLYANGRLTGKGKIIFE